MKLKVAVIDDEPDIRVLLRDVLEMEGHDVIEAENGVVGFELIRSEYPDLIICDIAMPKMTGDQLFNELRSSDSDLAVIPFIFLSGHLDKGEKIERLNNGANGCFSKPIDLSLFMAHINSQLSGITRTTDFIKRKLDLVAMKFPETIKSDFVVYDSLITNTSAYVIAIVDTIESLHKSDNSQIKDKIITQVDYLRFCLSQLKARNLLVRTANGEELSWEMIFLVALAQMEGKKIYVSDLYVSVAAAKSTINTRINSLIEEGVLEKINDANDRRRQFIILTDQFMPVLMSHINSSICLIKEAIQQPESEW